MHRSDDSGTTENFTDYMAQTAPDIWTYGPIEPWDVDGPAAAKAPRRTSGVVAAVAAGQGSIGYADASQIGDLPAAAVGVAGEFVEFSPEAAGRIVDASDASRADAAISTSPSRSTATLTRPTRPCTRSRWSRYHIVCLEYEDSGRRSTSSRRS